MKVYDEEIEINDDDGFERDEVTGRKSRRPKMSILNKTKISKWELDELFAGEEY